jgi:hypothetical protein
MSANEIDIQSKMKLGAGYQHLENKKYDNDGNESAGIKRPRESGVNFLVQRSALTKWSEQPGSRALLIINNKLIFRKETARLRLFCNRGYTSE